MAAKETMTDMKEPEADLFGQITRWGRYQWFLLAICSLPSFVCAVQSLHFVFTDANPKHRLVLVGNSALSS